MQIIQHETLERAIAFPYVKELTIALKISI